MNLSLNFHWFFQIHYLRTNLARFDPSPGWFRNYYYNRVSSYRFESSRSAPGISSEVHLSSSAHAGTGFLSLVSWKSPFSSLLFLHCFSLFWKIKFIEILIEKSLKNSSKFSMKNHWKIQMKLENHWKIQRKNLKEKFKWKIQMKNSKEKFKWKIQRKNSIEFNEKTHKVSLVVFSRFLYLVSKLIRSPSKLFFLIINLSIFSCNPRLSLSILLIFSKVSVRASKSLCLCCKSAETLIKKEKINGKSKKNQWKPF